MVSWTLSQRVTLEHIPKGTTTTSTGAAAEESRGKTISGTAGEQQDQPIALSRGFGSSSTRSGRCWAE